MTLNICWNNIIESALREIEELSQRSVNVIREHEEPVQNSIFAELQLQEPPIAVGSAKTVHRAKWHCDDVAVLTVHGGGSDYVQPAELQSLSEHPGLTRVRHICKSPEGNVVIVTEFAPMGSLDKVLRDLRGEKGRTISNQTLVQCAIQVCAGMERLVEECLLHKNLSLHNVLVFDFHPDDPQRVRVKVADYWFEGGSAYSLGELALPFRWMAPESLTRRRWSEMSIVWSFGVLMWEMWSEEAAPYSSLSSAEEVASLIGRGDRLPKPEGCPEDIYGLMQLCWERSPARRPGFRQLSEDLRRMSGEIPA
uniref:Proto-oncogene tyrosine-protein kinase ROS n=1 Tax=Tetraselmis sp. GSL018 TaxID=582737 RepID=A0A061RC01_9CHLO